MKLNFTTDFIRESLIFILSAIGLVGSYLIGSPLLATVSAIILFTSFDVFGYYRMGTTSNKEIVPYYRVMQTIFQHIITAFLWFLFGWQFALIYNIFWWFGGCDILYYVILKQNYFTYGPMFWLWWTPAGIVLSRFGESPSPRLATIQSIVGLVLCIVLYVVL